MDSLDMGVEVEKWYPVTMESNKTNGGESSSIRLRFKYQVKTASPTFTRNFFSFHVRGVFRGKCALLKLKETKILTTR